MRILVTGVSSEVQYAKGILSFRNLRTEPSDETAVHYGATGLAGRKLLGTTFLEGTWDALLMLDLDMDFPVDLHNLMNHHLD